MNLHRKLLLSIFMMLTTPMVFSQNLMRDFNGSTDYVTATLPTFIYSGKGLADFTIECWVRPDNFTGYSTYTRFYELYHDASNFIQLDIPADNYIQAVVKDAGTYYQKRSSHALTAGVWYHVAIVYYNTDGILKLFINGVEQTGAGGDLESAGGVADKIFLGRRGDGNGKYTGALDEFRIWSNLHSREDIRTYMYQECPVDATGLTVYYKMNGTNATFVDNAVGYQNEGTAYGTPAILPSPAFEGPKYSLFFAGTTWDSYVDCGLPTDHNSPNVITIEAWVRLVSNAGGYDRILVRSMDGNTDFEHCAYGLAFDGNGNHPKFSISGHVIISPVACSLYRWYHVAGTYDRNAGDGAEMKLYINGELVQTGNFTDAIYIGNDYKVTMGASIDNAGITNYFLNGNLDEVRLWESARTADQLRQNMCKSLTGNEAALASYYPFDNTNGTITPNQDIGGTQYDGVLNNFVDGDASTGSWRYNPAFSTWLNTNDQTADRWSTTTNWSTGSVPATDMSVGITLTDDASAYAIIDVLAELDNVVVDDDADWVIYNAADNTAATVFNYGSMEVASGALEVTNACYNRGISSTLTLGPGSSGTTIQTTLSNEGTMDLEANGGNYASLITNGTIDNTGTINIGLYSIANDQKWHHFSSPLATYTISTGNLSPVATEDDLYVWYEPSPGTWVNYFNTTAAPTFATANGSADAFEPGRGYLLAYQNSFTHTLTGTPQTGQVDVSLSYTTGKDPEAWSWSAGWNLLGNPYPSAIDWHEAVATTALLFDNYAYLYDPDKVGGADYVYVDGGSAGACIASQQGFFVKATGSGTFSFTDAMRVHNTMAPYKAVTTGQTLQLQLSAQSYQNSTTIRRYEGSDWDHDPADALKLYSYDPAVPMLFSYSTDDLRLAVNSIPEWGNERAIPLGMRFPQSDTYLLSVTEIPDDLMDKPLYLEDKTTGSYTRFDSSPVYIDGQEGEVTDRWVLHIGVTGLDEMHDTAPWVAWYGGGNLHVTGYEGPAMLQVYQPEGRCVMSEKAELSSHYVLPFHPATGVYIIRIAADNQVSTTKIMINN